MVTAKGLHRRASTLLYFLPEHSDFDFAWGPGKRGSR
jgi:hypothetical protein